MNLAKKFKVVEQFKRGKKHNQELCEDDYVITDSFVAVIDGATNKSDMEINNRTPGKFIAEIISESLRTCPKDFNIDQIIDHINNDIVKEYKKHHVYEDMIHKKTDIPNASMVLYSTYHHKIWMIGDCQCLIDGQLYDNPKEIDHVTAAARSLYISLEIAEGKEIHELMKRDTGREYILPLLERQSRFMNAKGDSPFSYSAITGFDVAFDQTREINISREARCIVLASDGYPFLENTLEKTEQRLYEIIEEDPLCYRSFQSTKGIKSGDDSFDDRTYIRLELFE